MMEQRAQNFSAKYKCAQSFLTTSLVLIVFHFFPKETLLCHESSGKGSIIQQRTKNICMSTQGYKASKEGQCKSYIEALQVHSFLSSFFPV